METMFERRHACTAGGRGCKSAADRGCKSAAINKWDYYVSIFKNSKIDNISRYGEAGPGPSGSAMTVEFELEGQEFMALNGGQPSTGSPAIALFVNCEKQSEVNALWDKLSEGGEKLQCGWLRDKYGCS